MYCLKTKKHGTNRVSLCYLAQSKKVNVWVKNSKLKLSIMNILSYQSVAWIGCHSMNDSGGSSPRSISIGQLNTLLCLHLRPIKLVVCKWPYSFKMMGYLILKYVSRLDAFSVYQNRTRLPSYALGRTTGAPEVRPTRSSRTKVSPSQISNAHDR